MLTKTHRKGGGLFLGIRVVYPVTVTNDRHWKLVNGKLVRRPHQLIVWRIEIGFITHTLTIHFKKPKL